MSHEPLTRWSPKVQLLGKFNLLTKALLSDSNAPKNFVDKTQQIMKHLLRFIILVVLLCPDFTTERLYAQQPQREAPAFSERVDVVTEPDSPERDYEMRGVFWLGILLVGVFLYQGLRVYKHLHPRFALSSTQLHTLHTTRQNLIEHIASLDEQCASGEIDQDLYRTQRNRHKQRLIDITMICQSPQTRESL